MKKIEGGIIAPIITPLLNFDKVDYEGLESLINHAIDGGVSAISILGQTGEEMCLDFKTRSILISESCRIVGGRVPVLVSLSGASIMESYFLGNFAANCGADAIISAPPYFYNVGQAELLEYYKDLLDKLPLPVIVYNSCGNFNAILDPETILKLSEYKGILGIKDSTANSVRFNSVLATVKEQNRDFKVLVGNEELLGESVLLGADGGMAGGACIYPKLYVALYNAAKNKDLQEYLELQRVIMTVSRKLYSVGQYHSSYIKGIKCALSIKGFINDDYMAPPFHKFNVPERKKIEQALDEVENLIPNIYK